MAEQKEAKYTILIVDDDNDIVTTMKMALDDLGQTLLTASDGIAALEIAEAQPPDIVVLDLMLPKRGGFQVLQRLKGSSTMKGKRPLICMVTANEGMRHQKFAEQNGVDDYLRKPFAISNLVEIVQGFMAKLDKGIENAR